MKITGITTHVVNVCAAQSHEVWIERFYCDFDETPLGNAVNPQRGRIAVPQGPGLGIDPDPAVLRKLAVDA